MRTCSMSFTKPNIMHTWLPGAPICVETHGSRVNKTRSVKAEMAERRHSARWQAAPGVGRAGVHQLGGAAGAAAGAVAQRRITRPPPPHKQEAQRLRIAQT